MRAHLRWFLLEREVARLPLKSKPIRSSAVSGSPTSVLAFLNDG
jgi:hypothetical protein